MLAAVLWLGNISFLVTDSQNHIEVVVDEGSLFLVCVLSFITLFVCVLKIRLWSIFRN